VSDAPNHHARYVPHGVDDLSETRPQHVGDFVTNGNYAKAAVMELGLNTALYPTSSTERIGLKLCYRPRPGTYVSKKIQKVAILYREINRNYLHLISIQ